MDKKDIIENIFFNEIIKEASTGEVKVLLNDIYKEEYIFNVGFNTFLEKTFACNDSFDSKPVLIINDKDRLVNLLCDYVKLCDSSPNIFKNYELNVRVKCYLTNLWANALYDDFANPCLFVKKQIDFYQNKLCTENSFIYNTIDDSKIKIEDLKQDIRMETPFFFRASFIKDDDIYNLPKISYGISNNVCYIYAIQNEKESITTSFQKRIKRKLYKLNEGVSTLETDEYRDYKDNGDYYPENISDVSPSVLIALSIFFDILKDKGIDKVKVISLLPVRYNSRELALKKRYEDKLKDSKLNDKDLKKLLLEYKVENLRIQKNLSDKMIRNFRRLEAHFNNCLITSFPMEFDEYLHLNIKPYQYGSNQFLDNIIKKDYNISK